MRTWDSVGVTNSDRIRDFWHGWLVEGGEWSSGSHTATVASFSPWVTLNAPTGGWTDAAVQALEAKVFKQDAVNAQIVVSLVEFEVTAVADDAQQHPSTTM